MHLWDVSTGELIRTFTLRFSAGRILCSPEGGVAVVTNESKPGISPGKCLSSVFDLETGEELLYLEGGYAEVALAPRSIFADTLYGTVEFP